MTRLATALLCALLVGCDRSASYFEAHPEQRAEVQAGCRRGSIRGWECENASAAEAYEQHKDAERTFRGGIEAR